MSSTSIALMEDFDPFSEEGRRVPIPLCDWNRPCNGYGEYQNLTAINGLPQYSLLCKKHDEIVNELRGLHGRPVTDLDGLMALFKKLMGPELAEEAPSEISAPEAASEPDEEKPQPETEEVAPAEAEVTPQEAAEEAAPILDFTEPEKTHEEPVEEKAPPTPGVYNLEERPSEDHYFCVEMAGVEEPCNAWKHKKDLKYHARKTHGIEPYQQHLLPEEKFKCVRGDHIAAGCVQSWPTQGALSAHHMRTKLKFPAAAIPHPTPEQTPQQQPADADHATT